MARRRQFDHVALCALLISSHALAQDVALEPPRVQIVHRASASCPGSVAFEKEVRARVRRPLDWVLDEPSILVTVQIEATDRGAVGHLQVDAQGSEPTYRDFEAETCAEVNAALALVVALTLDPNARTETVEPEPPASQPARPSAPSVTTAPKRDRAPQPQQSTTKKGEASFYFGPAAMASTGYDPSGLVALGAVLGGHLVRRSWFSPAAQLIPLWGKTGTTGPEAANASFSWLLLRLEACPLRADLSPQLALVPCVAGEAGRVVARGRAGSVEVADEATRPWAAAGVSLGLHWSVDRWFATAAATGLAPMVRDEFVFLEPRLPVHRAPAVIFGGLLGAGVQL